MEVSGQLHDPAALPPGKQPLVYIEKAAVWTPGILKFIRQEVLLIRMLCLQIPSTKSFGILPRIVTTNLVPLEGKLNES
jgi:hypothetical protein